jgi:hypothetical protein
LPQQAGVNRTVAQQKPPSIEPAYPRSGTVRVIVPRIRLAMVISGVPNAS